MRPFVAAAAASLFLHAALWGKGVQRERPELGHPFLWLSSPPFFTERKGRSGRIFPTSSAKGTGGTATGRAAPQWRALGDLVALGNTPPEYPAEALDREWEGVVRLLVDFDEAGGAAEVAVETSSGHGVLDQAAVEAARRWHLSESGPKRSLIVPVSFRLSDEG